MICVSKQALSGIRRAWHMGATKDSLYAMIRELYGFDLVEGFFWVGANRDDYLKGLKKGFEEEK